MAVLQDLVNHLNNSYLIQITRKKKYIKLTFKGREKHTQSNFILRGVRYATFKHLEATNVIESIIVKNKRDFTEADYQIYPEIKQCSKPWNYFIRIEGKQGLHGIVLFKSGELNLEYIRKKHLPQKSVIIQQKDKSYRYNYSLN